ncbi:hypothetical protein [Phreatobacter stygius]|uniref:Uncharacterized protein n=1 Tax=Phreatobacter stygius TaxID=1940610 RepID=A0A4D7B2K6_9HYPH|nr:hypothetical protein [Phreatobacter stygius]QCI65273.1 hypothetical protein E8M01_14275 [Phreatobacter stygius]
MRAAAKKAAADQKRRDAEAAKARRARLDALAQQGEAVWHQVQAEITRSNGPAYDRAAATLLDLKTLAEERGTATDFHRRLAGLVEQHARKQRFIERLRQHDLGT